MCFLVYGAFSGPGYGSTTVQIRPNIEKGSTTMLQITSSSAPRSGLQRRLQMTIGAIAITVGAAVIALVAASSALAASPASPPPVTILSSSPFVGHGGDFFISPFGDSSTYANGPEIVNSEGNVV